MIRPSGNRAGGGAMGGERRSSSGRRSKDARPSLSYELLEAGLFVANVIAWGWLARLVTG